MRNLCMALAISLLLTSCVQAPEFTLPEPTTETPVVEVAPEPTPTPSLPLWSEEEAVALAQMLWGEARGVSLRYRKSGLCVVRSKPVRLIRKRYHRSCKRTLPVCRLFTGQSG